MATVREPRNLDLDRSLQTLRWSPLAEPVSYKKGSKVRKSGLAMVHRGETIIPRGKAKKSQHSAICDVEKRTVLNLLTTAGDCCERFMEGTLRNVPVRDLQLDECWTYVQKKEGETILLVWKSSGAERTTSALQRMVGRPQPPRKPLWHAGDT